LARPNFPAVFNLAAVLCLWATSALAANISLSQLGDDPAHARVAVDGRFEASDEIKFRTQVGRLTKAVVVFNSDGGPGDGGRRATAGDDREMNNEPPEREPIDRMRARLEALLKATAAPRCGARSKRTGKPCRGAAMPNGRCKLHGGKSTGPRTPEGLERSRRANWKHGHFSREAKAERSRVRAAILALRYLRMLGH
jgi:hypothetical protein